MSAELARRWLVVTRALAEATHQRNHAEVLRLRQLRRALKRRLLVKMA